MELQTISQVSKTYDISSRMLRYYEQVGLIKSIRNEDNTYRLYDEEALIRVQQIIILRKLQIPVKQIAVIMNNPDAVTVIEIFKSKISELDSEITALSTVKNILDEFVKELEGVSELNLNVNFLNDSSLLKLAGPLSIVQKNIKENITINELNKAAQLLNKLKNVRAVYLPPMTVAAAYFTGDKSRENAWEAINTFVKQKELLKIKPDLRVFRVEISNASGQNFGNEMWVSIPPDLDVPSPLTKKIFHGGQYAAHVLGEDGFLTYLGLQDWINESDKYQYDYDGNLKRCDPPFEEIVSFGGIRLDPEEILNYQNCIDSAYPSAGDQIDVLFPIKNYMITDVIPEEIPHSKEKCGFKASIVTKNKFKIIGFTKIMTPESNDSDAFIEEIKKNGCLDILHKFKKPGAPILDYGSHDMDSQIKGGWRHTICLAEADVTDLASLTKHDVYIETIDTSRWVIFEYTKGDAFDGHSICMKLGYTWNGVISGSITVIPDGILDKVDPNDEAEMKKPVYCWYPVK